MRCFQQRPFSSHIYNLQGVIYDGSIESHRKMITSDGSIQSTDEAPSTRTPVARGGRIRITPPSGGSFRRGRGGDSNDVHPVIKRRRLYLGDGEGSIVWSSVPTRVHQQHQADGQDSLMLTDIADQGEGDFELVTPQKKLLNSIDVVEKVVMVELDRLKRTPSVRKAEREKKVRTLMLMR